MQNTRKASEAGFLSNDYVNFLALVIVVGFVVAFILSGLVGRLLLVALVVLIIGLIGYVEWITSPLRPGDIVRIQRREFSGWLAVVAPDQSPERPGGVSVIPCWQDGLEEVTYTEYGGFLDRVLRWGVPQRVEDESWTVERLREVGREHCRGRDVLKAKLGWVRSWDQVAIVAPTGGVRLVSVDGLSREEMERDWHSWYEGGCAPAQVAILPGEREIVTVGGSLPGAQTLRFTAEAGHLYGYSSGFGGASGSSPDGSAPNRVRFVDFTAGRVVDGQGTDGPGKGGTT